MQGVPQPGLSLIRKFEGCHLEAYPDPLTGGKPYTIGWGSTRRKDGSPFQLGETITQAEADELLRWQVERDFLPALERIPVWPQLNAAQAGAILSFAYNLGAGFYGASGFSTLSQVLREERWQDIEYALILYRNPGSNVEEGLLRRRLSEAQLFLSETPGVALSQAGTTYLSDSARTYSQHPQLSDQAIQYLAFIQGKPAPTPSPKSPQPQPEPPASGQPRTLYLADPYLQGEDVKQIQEALIQAGADIVADGVFGPGTQQAVENFQRAHQLTVDGVVGPNTRTQLLKRTLYLMHPYLQGEDVTAVQQALREKGFNVAVDGVFGPGTQAAVEAFQQQAGLLMDGVVGPRTRRILMARPLRLTSPNLQGEDVRTVQAALSQAGLSLTVDGIFGPGTEWAVKQFQTRNHLRADGVVDARTLAKLVF